MREVWKAMKDFPNVSISNKGNIIKYNKKGKEVPISLCYVGKPKYLAFNVFEGNKQHKLYLHREVMKLHGPEQPENMTHVCFLDKNPHNCNVNNLYWSTQVIRMQRRKAENGYESGEKHFAAIFNDEDIEIMKKLWATNQYTKTNLAKIFGCHPSTVDSILAGRNWSHVKI